MPLYLREHFGEQIVLRFHAFTIQSLEQNITRVIRQLQGEMLERVIENWTQRMDHLRRSRGQYLKEIILKKYMPLNLNFL